MEAYQGGDVTIGAGVVVILHVSRISRQTYIETMQPRPFEEWIEKGHQRDANLCGAYARPTDERSFVRRAGEYNQGSPHGKKRKQKHFYSVPCFFFPPGPFFVVGVALFL